MLRAFVSSTHYKYLEKGGTDEETAEGKASQAPG
jgi:hypothetical protein